jgi:hypothetical protein
MVKTNSFKCQKYSLKMLNLRMIDIFLKLIILINIYFLLIFYILKYFLIIFVVNFYYADYLLMILVYH